MTNVLEVITVVGTIFVFLYLLWALLRPESF